MKEKLLVSVNGGKNLKKKKTWILLKLKLHNSKYKTKYVYGGENVVFQKETFIFEVNEDVYPAGDLEVKVKTWEMFKKGEVFACATVPLAPITSEIRESANGITSILLSTSTSSSSSNGSGVICSNNSLLQKKVALKSKKGEDTSSELTISFELLPENETATTMKSIPLLFRWFPDLPHSETVISECYCTKEAKKAISMSHNGTMYITQNYLCFRSPSHLAKNKKTMIHFKDITRIKKKIGSFYLPNAIEVRTTKKKYLFASFMHRSKAYMLLVNQWNLHGGSERDGGNSTIDDDDDDDDDDNTADLEDDEEVSSIMSSSGKSSAANRSLSPFARLNDSTSSNGSSGGTLRKSRSQSVGSNNLASSSSSKSPSKPGTPVPSASITESKSSSSGNLNSNSNFNPNQIKLVIEVEDFEQLGLGPTNNQLMLTVLRDSTVLELLEKLRLKLAPSDDKFGASRVLALAKTKKKKKTKRSSGVYRPLDQLTTDQPLEEDIAAYATLLHRASGKSSGGNALVERKFIVLDGHKQLATYSLENQDILYLKKPRYVEDVNLSFEIVEDKSKVIKLILSIDTKISEIFKDLSKFYSKKLYVTDYYLYIPKNGERGAVLDSEKTLADYNIRSNCTIQVMRYPPFENFSQKFKNGSSRNKRSLLFELIQACMTLSIPSTQMQLMEQPQDFLNRLQQKLQLDDVDAKTITANVLAINEYKDEGLLVELKSRCEMLTSKYDVDPYYNAESFGNNEAYETWKRLELNHVAHLMKNIIFKEDCFFGVLFVRLIEAEDLSVDPINQYCILSTPHHRVKSSTQLNTDQPEWNQSFLLKLRKPKGKLEIAVMSSTASTDNFLGKVEINIKDLEDTCGNPKDMWLSLPTKGRIHLSLEYQYQFSEYNNYLNHILNPTASIEEEDITNYDDDSDNDGNEVKQHQKKQQQQPKYSNKFDLSKHIPIDHVALYKILFAFVMEERDRMFASSPEVSTSTPLSPAISSPPLPESSGDDTDWLTLPFRSLLSQYSMRFGVCKTSANIIQIEAMTEKYSIEKSYIFELEEVSTTLLDILSGKDESVFTTNEIQILKQAVEKLVPKISYNIGRYYESFPSNKPRGCLKSLVKAYDNTLLMRGIIHKNPVTNFNQRLSLCIQEESKRKFEENIAALGFMSMEYDQKVKEVVTITNMLVEVLSIISEEIEHTIHFESAFPPEVKITCDVIDTWGVCIASVIEDFCNWAPYFPGILILVKKLLEYYNFTKKLAGDRFKPLPLKQLFITYVYKLLKAIKSQLNTKVRECIEKDDKKTVSITQGVSSSYVQFFEACDAAIKDFSSLAWLPDSFSYVQLLEAMTSEIINYCRATADDFKHYIQHTEVEQRGQPTLFTLNVEPVVMLNNLDAAKTKLDYYIQKIEREMNRHLGSSQAAHLDANARQCVVESFKQCAEEAKTIVSESYNQCMQSITDRMKQHVFYQFQDVLFSEPLVSINSHLTENSEDIDSGVVTTQSSSGASTLFEPVHDASVLLKNADNPIPTIKTSSNKDNLKYEKAILNVTKEFLSPKIEELYSKLKEPLFKAFIKKLWGELIDDLCYLVVPRPNEQMLPFHCQHIIRADEQISIVNNCVKDLITLFHKGGAGCPTPTLEERANPLKQMLIASGMETTPLIDLYNQKKTVGSSKTTTLNFVTKEQIVGILGTRVEFDKESLKFVNRINGVVEKPIAPEVEQIKVVPETEFIIERYHCSLNGQLGVMILSSRYLGFQNLLKEIGVKLGSKVSIPLINIEEIKKTKIALLLKAIQVNTKDGHSYTFTGFFDRDSVFVDISNQMKVAQKKKK